MKFSILQQDLLSSLQAVARSAGVRSQLPVLGNILIQASSEGLKLAATNLEVGVVKKIKAEVLEDGEVTVPAKTFVEIISNLGGEKLLISASADQIEVTTPAFSSKFNGISADEFPAIPLSGKEAITVSTKLLLDSLPEVSFASAVDDGRPVLTGILTEIKGRKLQLVATDGYRLAHKIVEIPEDIEFKALIPRRTFEEVLRLLAEEKTETVSISTSDSQNQIIFTIGNTQFSSRLIEGQFPSWERIIPTSKKTTISFNRGDFLKAVKLASVFSRGEANIVKLQNLQGKITLTSEAKEVGGQKNQIEATVEGEDMEVAFNAKFLYEALSAFGAENAVLELSGPLSAALIRPEIKESLQYIIMPVNLS